MDQLVNFIIRPPRADYSPKDDLLEEKFRLSRRSRYYIRKDLDVINGQGKRLKCSHYLPLVIPEGKSLPCVIYCHGNSGCRADASEVAVLLLRSNITVFTLDFSGSGLSEGEHVTLGWNEKEDLKAVVNHLRSDGGVSFIGLWGRSMGAVTSLMYGAEDPSIAGMVLDSPFSNLVELMMELVDMYKYRLPKFTVKLAIQHMRKIIKKKANFDIMDLDTIEVAKRCFVPALFGHAVDDDFIRPHHSERICDAYMGDKNIIKFEGDHNSPRPQFYFHSVTIFFHNVLHPPDVLPEDDQFLPEDYFNQDIGYMNPSFNDSLTDDGFVTTEDAIAQVRSRRLMSRVEVPSGTPTKEDSISDGPSSSVSSRANLTPMMENADFLEYSLDSYAEIPCTAEDEQRMLMEAIMASLKDVKVESPEEKEQEDSRSNNVDTSSASPPCKTDMPTLPTSSSTSIPNSDIKDTVEDTTNDASTAPRPSSNADTSDGTRATLVVQRSRSGTIIDGLTQKLGFNFFKNNS